MKNMNEIEYKENLDREIDEFSAKVNTPAITPKLTFTQKITDKICFFVGSWNWFIWLTVITIWYMVINSIKHLAFDPYPYQFYTMLISVWALYGNIFIQMGTNRIMEQLLWTTMQDAEVNKDTYLSLVLLHEKTDIINNKLDIIERKLN